MYKYVQSMAPIIDERSEILILGSMPGEQSLQKQEYYGNPRNHFWPILYAHYQHRPCETYEEKKAFLLEHQLALWDSAEVCKRKGSSDNTITEVVPNDICRLLQEYPGVRLILLNGAAAERIFLKYIRERGGIVVRYERVPSTSPIPGRNVPNFDEKLETWSRRIHSIR